MFTYGSMAKKKISDLIAEWMDGFGRDNGYELSRCEFVKEAGSWYLRVYVDRLQDGAYGHMSAGDCDTVSRYLSEKLDEADPIEQNYYLEVSSPGLDRLLVKDKDFERFMGRQIEISLYKAMNGKKLIEGELTGYKDGTVTVKTAEGTELSVPREAAGKINLAVIF